MKPQTAREKAETLIALVRADYPNPTKHWMNPGGYCVGMALQNWAKQHPEIFSVDACPYNDTYSSPWCLINDLGKYEEAWQALTDAVAEAYS